MSVFVLLQTLNFFFHVIYWTFLIVIIVNVAYFAWLTWQDIIRLDLTLADLTHLSLPLQGFGAMCMQYALHAAVLKFAQVIIREVTFILVPPKPKLKQQVCFGRLFTSFYFGLFTCIVIYAVFGFCSSFFHLVFSFYCGFHFLGLFFVFSFYLLIFM